MTSFEEVFTDFSTQATPAKPNPIPHIRMRASSILSSHLLIDAYSAIVPSILGLLEVRCNLTASQTAWLLGIGALGSGLSQPVTAWLSDRYDSRILAGLGLGIAATCLSAIGGATNFTSLLLLFITGAMGVGMFHPIAASSMGQLSSGQRSVGVSLFFVAGMIGGMSGAFLAPRIATLPDGYPILSLMMMPGLACAYALHRLLKRLSHRPLGYETLRYQKKELAARWLMIGLLFVSATLRFAVNLALFYLYVRWVQEMVGLEHPDWARDRVAHESGPLVGNLNALTLFGMALGGMGAGLLIRPGQEKWPLVLVPIVFAPAIVLFPYVKLAQGHLLCVLAAIGFAAMIPVSIAVSQRLLPHRTSLASSLMMGGPWALAVLSPQLAELSIRHYGLTDTFFFAALTLVLAGLVALPARLNNPPS